MYLPRMAGFTRILVLVGVISNALWEIEAQQPSANMSRPNLGYILADDMGWGDVSFHGYNEIPTPEIDKLANDGVILNSFYAHYACTPSRAALMTGKYAIRTNVQRVILADDPRGLNLSTKLLPQYLKELGYSTHLVGKWHLGNSRSAMLPHNRGFDTFLGFYKGGTDYYNYTFFAAKPHQDPAKILPGYDLFDRNRPAIEFNGSYATEVFTKKAIEIIEAHKGSKTPFYLQLNHLAPHFANSGNMNQAPKKYIDRFPWIKHPGRRTYAGMMAALDESVGQVFNALKRAGRLDNTVLVFSSDNGGQGQEQNEIFKNVQDWTYATNRPLRGTKGTHFEGGIRVAGFVWSRLLKKAQRVSNELFHFTDILPTFYKLAGGKGMIAGLDGFNIWPSISEGRPSPREEISFMTDNNSNGPEYAMRWRQYKLYLNYTPTATGAQLNKRYEPFQFNQAYLKETKGTVKCNKNVSDQAFNASCNPNTAACLFDVVNDPCEMVNIAGQYPNIVANLTQKVMAMSRMYVARRPWPAGNPKAYNITKTTGLVAVGYMDDVSCTWENFCSI